MAKANRLPSPSRRLNPSPCERPRPSRPKPRRPKPRRMLDAGTRAGAEDTSRPRSGAPCSRATKGAARIRATRGNVAVRGMESSCTTRGRSLRVESTVSNTSRSAAALTTRLLPRRILAEPSSSSRAIRPSMSLGRRTRRPTAITCPSECGSVSADGCRGPRNAPASNELAHDRRRPTPASTPATPGRLPAWTRMRELLLRVGAPAEVDSLQRRAESFGEYFTELPARSAGRQRRHTERLIPVTDGQYQ
jgi:hypothetical protein